VAHEYSWQQAQGEATYRSDNHDHLGWWAAAAMLVSIILHVVVFFALDQVKFVLGIQDVAETPTQTVVVREPVEQIPSDFVAPPPAEDAVVPPPLDTAKLLDDVDLLPLLKDQDVEMKPDVDKTEIAIAVGNPTQSGDPRGETIDISAGMDSSKLDLPDFGRQDFEIKPAAIGQITVDPGASKADASNLDKFTDDLIKQGAGGKAEKGSLEGLASLDEMVGLSSNELLGKKTMLPSDLLFAFNKYEMRESARIGLLKLAMIIDKNRDMYCWIEGHTDLIGNDVANLELSIKRSEAVKSYLVDSLGLDPEKIITRGYGRYQPIVVSGDKDQQAPNRRVEIKMRKTPPPNEQIAPPKAAPVPEEMPPAPKRPEPAPAPEPVPPKARLVKPNPSMPVEVMEPPVRQAPKAKPVEAAPPAPRAKPVPEAPPARAIPVTEDVPGILKAQPVTE
jgi:OOP family OmpA-OmpF porin